MRKSILLYLFLFAALLALYFYVTGHRALVSCEQDVAQLREDLEADQRKSDSLAQAVPSEGIFSLMGNEEAMSYFEAQGLDPAEMSQKIEGLIIEKNRVDDDNDLIPFEGMEGYFRVNQVKLLNHKWAIASFSDGKYWGELLLSYEVEGQGQVRITTENALLYPLN